MKGEVPQYTVPAGSWQALRIKNPSSSSSWSLMGTTMTPGFEFSTFVLADRAELTRAYPRHRQIIEELTRE
ncbi:MAG: hypothetical protein EA369_00010 [Bradymonadales bacterium]|nr:MAG: hypothetical protein EA369_00010 [Bradymonadales bacterium]